VTKRLIDTDCEHWFWYMPEGMLVFESGTEWALGLVLRVQFLKNMRGKKMAVLLDLTLPQELWQQAIASNPDQSNFQYFMDAESHTQYSKSFRVGNPYE
jgi:hypothetical protein